LDEKAARSRYYYLHIVEEYQPRHLLHRCELQRRRWSAVREVVAEADKAKSPREGEQERQAPDRDADEEGNVNVSGLSACREADMGAQP
jgi:hypothetical protein